MIFVLFHGAFGKAEGNWFPELKSKLESLGQTVITQQFPEEDEKQLTESGPKTEINKITLTNWLATFKKIIPHIHNDEKLCFIGHSLGCIFILQVVAKYKIHLDSAIFVGPFLDCLPTEIWPYDTIIPDFIQHSYSLEELKKLIPDSYVLYSDDDPYVANEQSKRFAQSMNSSTIKLHKAGHMNAEVDLDEFALVLDLSLTRLDLSFANKYHFLSQKIGAFEYVYLNDEKGVVTLDAQSAFKEKLFNFHDVKKEGFATQFTGFVDVYEAHSAYMESSREAARRMNKFIRVILIEKMSDLNNPNWKEQMEADMQSGITIYLCRYDSVKDKIPEPDFGIWDNHHVVIGKFDWKSRRAKKVIVDNSSRAVKLARKWQKTIMENSLLVKDIDQDIKIFLRK